MKSPAIFLLAVVLAFVSAGCSSTVEHEGSKADSIGSKHQTYTVEISQMKFNPEEITVKKGDQIVFVNHDLVNHDVTEDLNSWSSSILEPNKEWTLTATVSQRYFCSIHMVMKGRIIVVE